MHCAPEVPLYFRFFFVYHLNMQKLGSFCIIFKVQNPLLSIAFPLQLC